MDAPRSGSPHDADPVSHGPWGLAADGLCLSATPVFAGMALLTVLAGSPSASPMCSSAGEAGPWSGMGPMYLLMAAVHSAPWLRRLAGTALLCRSSMDASE